MAESERVRLNAATPQRTLQYPIPTQCMQSRMAGLATGRGRKEQVTWDCTDLHSNRPAVVPPSPQSTREVEGSVLILCDLLITHRPVSHVETAVWAYILPVLPWTPFCTPIRQASPGHILICTLYSPPPKGTEKSTAPTQRLGRQADHQQNHVMFQPPDISSCFTDQ
jgi:hypothetical protein